MQSSVPIVAINQKMVEEAAYRILRWVRPPNVHDLRGWVLPYAIFSTLVNQDSICHIIIAITLKVPVHHFERAI
jgi:hypothetical protein